MKTCKCIETLRQHVADKTGDPKPEGPFEARFGYHEGRFYSCLTMTVLARKKKRDGSFCINPTLRFPVVVNFCPICGKELVENKEG